MPLTGMDRSGGTELAAQIEQENPVRRLPGRWLALERGGPTKPSRLSAVSMEQRRQRPPESGGARQPLRILVSYAHPDEERFGPAAP